MHQMLKQYCLIDTIMEATLDRTRHPAAKRSAVISAGERAFPVRLGCGTYGSFAEGGRRIDL